MVADMVALAGVMIGALENFQIGVLLIGAALVWTLGRYVIYAG